MYPYPPDQKYTIAPLQWKTEFGMLVATTVLGDFSFDPRGEIKHLRVRADLIFKPSNRYQAEVRYPCNDADHARRMGDSIFRDLLEDFLTPVSDEPKEALP